MGLDQFMSDDSEESTSISTRKKPKNVSLSRRQWKRLIYYDPAWVRTFAADWEDNEIKALVQLMDELEEEGIKHEKLSDDNMEKVYKIRDEIVEDYL